MAKQKEEKIKEKKPTSLKVFNGVFIFKIIWYTFAPAYSPLANVIITFLTNIIMFASLLKLTFDTKKKKYIFASVCAGFALFCSIIMATVYFFNH